MHHDGSRRQVTLDLTRAVRRFLHPFQKKLGVLRCERRLVADEVKQLNGAGGLEPIAILGGGVALESVFVVLQMKTGDAEGRDVRVDGGRAAHEMEDNVRGDVVAERGGEAKEFLQGNIDVRFRIFVLERTIGVRKDAIAEEKADGLVERKSILFDNVERRYRERKFEDRFHRRMRVRVEIAVECGMR